RAGHIVPVDFGIMGRVDEDTRGYLAELLVGFLRRDYRAVAEVQFRAGYVPSHQSVEMFAQACRSIGEPIFGKPSHEVPIAPSPAGRIWRPGFSEIIAVLALIAAIVAWWH